MKKSEMTPAQRAKSIADHDAFLKGERLRHANDFDDPGNASRRKWLTSVCDNDIAKVAQFAVTVMETNGRLAKENEELAEKLNYIYSIASALASKSKVLPHEKLNFARLVAEDDPDDPVVRVFFAAQEIEKTLMAMANAYKGHAKRNRAKAFVQSEWKNHHQAYAGNKSAFSRDYVRRVFNEMEVTVTEKQMREVWLNDTLSASKPDGLAADG